MEAAIALVGYYQEMVDERRRSRRDDLTSALLDAEIDGDKLTDDEIIAFLFLMVVAGNETTTKLLGNAWYWGWRNPEERAKPFADPRPGGELDRGDPPLRHLEPDAAAGDPCPHGTARHRPSPRAAGCCCWWARPTATSRSSPTPTATTSTATPADWSASAAAATSAWAPPWPGSRPASACAELVERVAAYEVDPEGIERVHSINVRGLAALPTTVTLR